MGGNTFLPDISHGNGLVDSESVNRNYDLSLRLKLRERVQFSQRIPVARLSVTMEEI